MSTNTKRALSLDEQVKKRAKVTAVACGIAAAAIAVAAFALISAGIETARVEGSLRSVVVTTKDVSAGSAVTADNCKVARIPASALSTGSVDEGDWNEVAGRIALVDLPANTQITDAGLAKSSTASSLSAALGAGMEAVSIDVSSVTGVSGLLRPGDSVRVEAGGRDGSLEVLCVRRVIALDSSLETGGNGYSNVTLEVSGPEAEAVRSAQAASLPIYLTLLAG